MKIMLDKMHSPCAMCFGKGILYNPNSIHCQRCEYNIAISLLKRILKEELYCAACKDSKSLGGGYWECVVPDDDNYCNNGENLIIDWEYACKEYGLKYDK